MGRAQLPEFKISRDAGVPFYYYDVVTRAAADPKMTVLQLYTKIAYDELQFVKMDDTYHAEYEMSVTIFNQQGGQADGKIVKNEIMADAYKETNSLTRFDVSEIGFILVPGKYELLIRIMDLDSKKTGRRKTEIMVPDYQGPDMAVSDIFLVDSLTMDSLGNQIAFPNVMGNFGEVQEKLYMSYEVYHPSETDSIETMVSIITPEGKVLRKMKGYAMVTEDGIREVFPVPRDDLDIGKYKLKLKVGNGKRSVEKMKDFSVRWIGMPAMVYDLNNAIEQLRYVAKGSVIKKMKKAKESEKIEMFKEFWEELDPTPGTEVNELMQEYYRRIDFTNAKFSRYMEGWKTDRGMVYIFLGPPNDIERHPFEVNSKPYEIWAYYHMNREFIFVDMTGFGDYRLATPFSEVLENMR